MFLPCVIAKGIALNRTRTANAGDFGVWRYAREMARRSIESRIAPVICAATA